MFYSLLHFELVLFGMVGAACMEGDDYPVNTPDNPPYLSSCNFLSFHLGYTFKMDFETLHFKDNIVLHK